MNKTKALEIRINTNKNAEKDFNEWSINLIPELPLRANILDLGCGTGKQVNIFSQFFDKDSRIIALDKSLENIKILEKRYTGLPKLELINADFKHFSKDMKFKDNFFDIIYSFYALYYAEDLEGVMRKVYNILKGGGRFWTVSPYIGTNDEIFRILTKFYQLESKVMYSIEKFYRDIISLCKEVGFKEIKIDIFKNKIIYENKKSLIKYLQNTTFYNKEYEDKILTEIDKLFFNTTPFRLSKNAISIKVKK